MIQSDRDPATPIEGARRTQKLFAGARLLTVVNEGDHTTQGRASGQSAKAPGLIGTVQQINAGIVAPPTAPGADVVVRDPYCAPLPAAG